MKKIFTLVFCFLAFSSFAQHLQKTIINSCGVIYTSGAVQLRTSIGEPIVGSFNHSPVIFSEGFFTGTGSKLIVIDSPDVVTSFSFYPNPAVSKIYIKGDWQQIGRIQFVNVLGQVALDTKIYSNAFFVSILSKGIYIGRVFGPQNELLYTFKILKQ